MRVFVYYNLHSGKWSVKALEGAYKGLVVAHSDKVELVGVVARVSEKGRQRVLREGKKNVHAGLVGVLASLEGAMPVKGRPLPTCLGTGPVPADIGQPITYNPYKAGHFYYKNNREQYVTSFYAFLLNKTVNVL